MYKKMMVPIDLAHADLLGKALATATDLARHYDIPVCFVGVTAETPTALAHTPNEYAQKLQGYVDGLAETRGLAVSTVALPSHDPAIDLDSKLVRAAEDIGADLIVMASHVPGIPEHFFSSHAGAVASHAGVSVFVVR
tara:strand:- start:422 stop:835 length:414 start_codon:yes stop_codon:yes gene_type:complete